MDATCRQLNTVVAPDIVDARGIAIYRDRDSPAGGIEVN
jgi:hypothetical protein